MCEIQFTMSNKPIVAKIMTNLLHMGYGNGHKDATGILYKDGDEYEFTKAAGGVQNLFKGTSTLTKRLTKSKFIIGHNRYTTQGDEDNNENNHPFILKDWAMVHNGMLTITDKGEELAKTMMQEGIETDSYIFMALFVYYYERSTEQSMHDKVHDAIQLTLDEHNGNFSIFLVNTKHDECYYFKCANKQFTFIAEETGAIWKVLGSTTRNNLGKSFGKSVDKGVFKKLTVGNRYEFTPSSLKLYHISTKSTRIDDIFTNIGKFDYTNIVTKTHTSYTSAYDKWNDEPTAREFDDYYPETAKFLTKLGVVYDDFAWWEGDYGNLYIHEVDKEQARELIKIGDAEGIEIVETATKNFEFKLTYWYQIAGYDYDDDVKKITNYYGDE